MIRRLKAVAVAAALVFGLAACSTGSSDTAADSADAGSGSAGGGLIAIITVDPANPYWKAEVDTAKAEAEALGYSTTVNAHGNDPAKQT